MGQRIIATHDGKGGFIYKAVRMAKYKGKQLEPEAPMSVEGVRGKIASRNKAIEERVQRIAVHEINDRLRSWDTVEGRNYAFNVFKCYPGLNDKKPTECMPVHVKALYGGTQRGRSSATEHEHAIINRVILDYRDKGWDVEEYWPSEVSGATGPTLLLFSMGQEDG